MNTRVKDMTSGTPWKQLLTFALPLMLGNVFQQLYTVMDSVIVGQGIGVSALAAIGAADWFNWMVIGLATGFAQGFSILMAQQFGARDYGNLRKTVASSYVLSLMIAVVFTVAMQITASPVLQFLNTPDHIMGDSLGYLRVSFGGLIVVMAYNMLASVLRALGDSKTPLIAMVIAAIINIVLDIVFVMGFHLGVASAAAATVIAQVFSAVYCYRAIRKIPILKLERSDWHMERRRVGKLMYLGAPMAFQNVIIAIGGMVIQSVVNKFGLLFVAGFTATNKLYGLLEVAATSFAFSMTTYTGQNLGAKKIDRISRGMRSALVMSFVTSEIIALAMIFFGKYILRLFISGTADEVDTVLGIAYQYLFIMSVLLFILYILHVTRAAIQGMGDTVIPMASGITEMVMRVLVVLLLPQFFGQISVYFAEVAAWIGADVLLITAYIIKMRRLKGEAQQEEMLP